MVKKYDFGGYATKNGLKCSDGRIIIKDAFKHNDGQTVPLVWSHCHDKPDNILGHALLENREDGVYAYGKFNDTTAGKNAKQLVEHGDITQLSIFANDLQEKLKNVMHGVIREVSLVLSGANPGARIDNLSFAHADGSINIDDTEAIIYTGLDLSTEEAAHEDAQKDNSMSHAENTTVGSIIEGMTEEQKNVMYAMVGRAISSSGEAQHSAKEGEGDTIMKTNVFDRTNNKSNSEGKTLTHDQLKLVFEDAQRRGSLRESVLSHAAEWGIENIEVLFPEAKNIRTTPDLIKRDDTWVSNILSGANKTPFSRIRSMSADLTEDEARAKGYITGSKKVEEVFSVMKRITTPTTIYIKQKLDRDNIVDITDFDVVSWIRAQMRMLLNEEIARAVLVGDGRTITNADHINTDNIRPIWTDDPFYSYKIKLPTTLTTINMIDEIVRARKNYKGSGTPTFYTTTDIVTEMLLVRDLNGRRMYPTMAELMSALRLSNIVEVEPMEGLTRNDGTDDLELIGIMVNMADYSIGSTRGGEVTGFEDFDIDYNQYKYLIETRCSGTLTKFQSAVVLEKVKAAG